MLSDIVEAFFYPPIYTADIFFKMQPYILEKIIFVVINKKSLCIL